MSRFSERARRVHKLLGAALVVLLGIAGACADAQAAPFYANESALINDGNPFNRATFIIDPGQGNTIARQDFALNPTYASYYAGKLFDMNFLAWAPVLTLHPGTAGWARCGLSPGHASPCASSITFNPVNGDIADNTITALSENGGFIAVACGNFSATTPSGPEPMPTISGTKSDARDGHGIDGVPITLVRNGVDVATTVTGVNPLTMAHGYYSFTLNADPPSNLGPGTYSLRETLPPGFTQVVAPAQFQVDAGVGATAFSGKDFVNAKTQPTIATTPSAAVHVGAKIFDTATVSGFSPTGTVDFTLFAPGDTTCGTPIGTTSGTLSGGVATSGNLVETTPGTYSWVARYGGDASNYDVTSPCGGETVIVYAPITATPMNFLGVEGAPLSATVANFSDPDPVSIPAEYGATIDWGDGTPPTTGTITQPAGTGTPYTVAGSHTYAEEGPYVPKVKITDVGNALNTSSVTDQATIADAALAGTGVPVAAIEGLPFTRKNLGSFTDANPGGPVSDFTGTVDWGDGTSTTGAEITGPAGGPFPIAGGHVYTKAGTYTITIPILDDGGSRTTIIDVVKVRDAFCAGTLTATDAAHVITGTVPGFLKLSGGTWIVRNANVGGSITLTPGTSLLVSNSKVGGAIIGASGGELIVSNSNVSGAIAGATNEVVAICGSIVGGSLDASHAPRGVQVCASTMGGAVGVSGSTAGVMIGDPAQQCAANRLTSAGASLFADDQSGFDMSGNTIYGSLRLSHSGGVDLPLIPANTTGEPVLAGNTIGGALLCDLSTPPPSNGGTANRVAGTRGGQCSATGF